MSQLYTCKLYIQIKIVIYYYYKRYEYVHVVKFISSVERIDVDTFQRIRYVGVNWAKPIMGIHVWDQSRFNLLTYRR